MSERTPKTTDVFALGEAKLDFYATLNPDVFDSLGLRHKGDNVYSLDELRAIQSRLTFDAIHPGGSIANSLTSLGMLGHMSYLLGFEPDDKGRIFRTRAEQNGIECAFHACDKPMKGNLLVLVNAMNGERTFVNADYSGTEKLPVITPTDADISALRRAFILALEGYDWLLPAKKALHHTLAPLANHHDTAVFLTLSDVSVIKKQRADLVPFIHNHVDVLCGNEEELGELVGQNLAQKNPKAIIQTLANAYPDTLIFMTAGTDGAYGWDGKTLHHVPCLAIEPDNIRNTNGAGDAFMAGAMDAFVRHKKTGSNDAPWIKDALVTGTVLSHFTVQSDDAYPNPTRLKNDKGPLTAGLLSKVQTLRV